ncbi:MAG: 50S ribosomal protein L11 methyltransferase [Xanthomonadales bacterium]|nr:50S ribosomal protein L11 methyltransferase [Gammaproteobacteria bacterium]NND57971.1 50S ribosomal protein L11 methyltransferase [Xanthomonadales bacterium]
MAWTEISISVTQDDAALAELILEELGALAVTLQDDEDNPVLEPEPGTTPLWPTVQVRGLFERDTDRDRVLAALGAVPGAERPDRFRWRNIGDRDWERAWLERFAPMQFGRQLWIVPGGMQIPFDPNNIEIRLDPGLAFGTGTHPTTALCLRWLDSQEVRGAAVVDYGCGSGILGIAAALKGARRVVCVDNDQQALEATADNAARNGVSTIIECCTPQEYQRELADVVMANILAAPLILLAPRLLAALRPGGLIALSGILNVQADEVLAAYRAGLLEAATQTEQEWVLIHGRSDPETPGAPRE